ncbi:hypothetical protein ACQY0O_001693 [Thecaphora frezii]
MSDRKGKTIFIGGISDMVTEQTLHQYFSPFGDIVEVNIPRQDGKHRGFGFVVFSNEREVEDAIDNMHLNEVAGRVVNVNVARPLKTSSTGSGAVWQDEEWIQQYALPSSSTIADTTTATADEATTAQT